MKRFLVLVFTLVLVFAAPLPAQLVRFKNFDASTTLVNGSLYTVRFSLDSALAKEALYLYINQTAPGSKYQIPAYHCFMPPFPQCDSTFTLVVSANDGQRLQLVASSYLSHTKGIIDSSGIATVVSRTGIRLHQDSLVVTVYPNPATDYITAQFEQEAGTIAVLYIITAKGEEVYRYTSRTAGQQWVGFDLNNLPSGAYFLRAEVSEKVSTTKFVKKQ